ncbi:MAG: ferritin [candidate division KSB1 bacterium]|nr:ferritin [candidate division KSB1 bacterium]MDZ7273577.1 ferritin [candidate division KSB1 bacterium]MDZ7286832.1 ferritin [candidate division KSB1 bacterium]MDZ7299811.1 ferritin [candidate division KSB1 bacterium]MDZ7350863.1 ferritin [candidate division KSB1 bacterium]
MLQKTVQDALNEQVKAELESAYIYLAMSACCESLSLRGFAHWMRVQSREEVGHALKLFDYVNDRGGRVVLQALAQPPVDYQSVLDMMEHALSHEQKVSGMIHRLYELALAESDYPTQAHLQWFLTEQVEEEKTAQEIVQQLKMIGNHMPALLMLDRQMGQRGNK